MKGLTIIVFGLPIEQELFLFRFTQPRMSFGNITRSRKLHLGYPIHQSAPLITVFPIVEKHNNSSVMNIRVDSSPALGP